MAKFLNEISISGSCLWILSCECCHTHVPRPPHADRTPNPTASTQPAPWPNDCFFAGGINSTLVNPDPPLPSALSHTLPRTRCHPHRAPPLPDELSSTPAPPPTPLTHPRTPSPACESSFTQWGPRFSSGSSKRERGTDVKEGFAHEKTAGTRLLQDHRTTDTTEKRSRQEDVGEIER